MRYRPYEIESGRAFEDVIDGKSWPPLEPGEELDLDGKKARIVHVGLPVFDPSNMFIPIAITFTVSPEIVDSLKRLFDDLDRPGWSRR